MTVVQPERFAGDLWRHPEPGALGIQYAPAQPEQHTRGGQLLRRAQPPHVRISGPLGGPRACDVDDLDREIRRLTDARDTLAALIQREPVTDTLGQGVLL